MPETWSAMVAASQRRDTPAVVTADAVWSGDELLARAAGAAAHLRDIAPPGPVPALLASTATAFAYVIGAAACRRPLAPLGPRLTERELAPCIAGLGSSVLLTEPEFEPLARALSSDVVVVEEPKPVEEPLDDDEPDSAAFILHTSGTTGTPKPVPYLQARLVHRVRINAEMCSLGPGDIYATPSPFHHIAGFGNYAVAMAVGAAVAPLPRFTVDTWSDLAAVGVTHALTVPTMLELLLDAGVLALPTLRTLQYGASPIHPDTLRRTMAALPDVRLVNIFGQTEGSPITCLTGDDHRRILDEGRDDLLQSVGRAAPGVEVRIAEADDRGIGEVVARGPHLMVTDAGGWLQTGDVGRLDDEGYLFLVGRRGDKIIRGGENVYPLEVEHVLETHPGVREAAVIGVPDQRWGELVKAVVVPADPAAAPSVDELRAHARQQLAGFKVPTEWVFAEALPRNASGKLLRRALADAAVNE